MFTDYNLSPGIYEVVYMYGNLHETDKLHTYTHHKKVSASLNFYTLRYGHVCRHKQHYY